MCAASSGSTLEFPVLQPCETGSTMWNQPTVKGQDEPELPAPAVAVMSAAFGSGHGRGMTTTGTAMSRRRQPPRRRLRPAETTRSHHAAPAQSSRVGDSRGRLDRDRAAERARTHHQRQSARPRERWGRGGFAGRRSRRWLLQDGCVSVIRPSASMPLELGERAPTR
ncbi:DUF1775 domain-containing protein [Rathayibacter iranicus]|uniref:DUF1775 domain-containing protein n=1 Tax=Rathayibacter iranicus TaxID=59737 RepID=UPI001365E809